jgi:MerR family transcriptional regulator, thiopeptide resistance regulator
MKLKRRYQVKETARIAGVSVRTLHHYDEIGLLVPQRRTPAGYRLYGEAELLRLQQICIGRELGLPLEEIRRALDDPKFDHVSALTKQRSWLMNRAQTTAAMIRAVDAALSMLENPREIIMNAKELFEGFDSSKYEAEAKQRWGNTDAYAESKKRTARFSASDWQRVGAEQSAIFTAAAAVMQAGKPSEDEAVLDVAERHRRYIDRWFYPCGASMHCALALMYENDSRFAEGIDSVAPGLTRFLSAAIRENARIR